MPSYKSTTSSPYGRAFALVLFAVGSSIEKMTMSVEMTLLQETKHFCSISSAHSCVSARCGKHVSLASQPVFRSHLRDSDLYLDKCM
jgi:hypothetical protein